MVRVPPSRPPRPRKAPVFSDAPTARRKTNPLSLGGLRAAVLRHDRQLRGSASLRNARSIADRGVPLVGNEFQLYRQRLHLGLCHRLLSDGKADGSHRRTPGVHFGGLRVEPGGDGARSDPSARLFGLALAASRICGDLFGQFNAGDLLGHRIQRRPLRPGAGRRRQLSGRNQDRRPLASEKRAGVVHRDFQRRQQRGHSAGRFSRALPRGEAAMGLAHRVLRDRRSGLRLAALLASPV